MDSSYGGMLLRYSAPNINLVKLLVQSGADINVEEGENKTTALLQATLHGHSQIVQYLLDKGAEINAPSKDGNSSLWFSLLVLAFGSRFWFLLLVLAFGSLFWFSLLVLAFGSRFWFLLLVLTLVLSFGSRFWFSLWFSLLVLAFGSCF